MTQPSKKDTTVQQNCPDAPSGRMSLAAYLAAGIGLAGVTGAAEAAIVNIDITDTRGDGTATTNDNISGLNAGLSVGGKKSIPGWLGTGTGKLELYRQFGSPALWGLDGDDSGGVFLQFLGGNAYASPANLPGGTTIDGSLANWSAVGGASVFRYGPSISADFGANSYMAFRFGTIGNFNYGWLEVTWNSTSSDWQILSGAYENTVNTAIAAGQGAASVPAPSPASLLALIVGGAALRQWRRGRRQQLLEHAAA